MLWHDKWVVWNGVAKRTLLFAWTENISILLLKWSNSSQNRRMGCWWRKRTTPNPNQESIGLDKWINANWRCWGKGVWVFLWQINIKRTQTRFATEGHMGLDVSVWLWVHANAIPSERNPEGCHSTAAQWAAALTNRPAVPTWYTSTALTLRPKPITHWLRLSNYH